MPGSVSIKSTGFPARSASYSNQRMMNSDGNPHPMAPNQNPATMGKDCGCEYHETPSTGIDKTGVGSLACNDAACEQVNKHPSAMDLAQAGSMRGR